MHYVFLAILSGSVVVSVHDTREACLGRKATMENRGITGWCFGIDDEDRPHAEYFSSSDGVLMGNPGSSYSERVRP